MEKNQFPSCLWFTVFSFKILNRKNFIRIKNEQLTSHTVIHDLQEPKNRYAHIL